jgi:hypothetical protein
MFSSLHDDIRNVTRIYDVRHWLASWSLTHRGYRLAMKLDDRKPLESNYLFQTPSVMSMSDPKDQTTIIPHNQQPLVTRTYPSIEELEKIIVSSAAAQKEWAKVPLSDRIAIANGFVVSTPRRPPCSEY